MTSPTFSKSIGSEVVAHCATGSSSSATIIMAQYCNPKCLRKLGAGAFGFSVDEVESFGLFSSCSFVVGFTSESLFSEVLGVLDPSFSKPPHVHCRVLTFFRRDPMRKPHFVPLRLLFRPRGRSFAGGSGVLLGIGVGGLGGAGALRLISVPALGSPPGYTHVGFSQVPPSTGYIGMVWLSRNGLWGLMTGLRGSGFCSQEDRFDVWLGYTEGGGLAKLGIGGYSYPCTGYCACGLMTPGNGGHSKEGL